jgi:uncharacterized peroxidase-related enzyme
LARVEAADPAALPAALQPLLRKFTADYGDFTNQALVLARSPEAFGHLYGLLDAWRQSASLPPRLVEIAVLTTSQVNRCSYCVGHHGVALLQYGLSAETVAQILEPAPPGLDELDILVRDYARLVSERPWGIRDRVFEELRKHFSEQQIVELTVRIALCGLFNRVNDALQIDSEDSVTAAMLETGVTAQAPEQDEAAEGEEPPRLEKQA